MYQLIFRNWKFALLWVVGISCSVAAFLEEGGGKDRMEASAQQIRERRQASTAEPAPISSEPAEPVPEADAAETEAPLGDEVVSTDPAPDDQTP